jgi:Flp pilus assembly protein TadD
MAEQSVRVQRDSPQALHTLGIVYFRQQRHQAAVDRLSQAVQKQPENLTYRDDLSRALQAAGRPDEARAALQPISPPATN